MQNEGLEWTLFDTPINLGEVVIPTVVEANSLKLYAKDKSGVSSLFYMGDDLVEHNVGNVFGGGNGVANRLAYWTNTTTIDDIGRTLTAGSVLFAGSDFLPQEDPTKLFYDDTLNRLGVGTTSLDKVLHVASTPSSGDDGVLVDAFGNLGFPSFTTRNSNGTQASPTAILSGNSLGNFQFGGRKATSFTNLAAAVNADAAENWTDAATGTNLRFFTTTLGTTTLVERFRAGSQGQWGIAGANYGTSGQVFTSGGAAAAPSWSTPVTDHGALTGLLDDDHTQYRLESADHTHQSTGLQAGTLDHGLALTGLTDDDHTLYALLAGRSGGQILIGGTGTTDDLTLRTTTGVGAVGADMIFQVGNNGATEAMRILNSAFIGIGRADPNAPLHIHGSNNPLVRLSSSVGGGTGMGINVDAANNAFLGNNTVNTFMAFSAQAGASGGLTFTADGGLSHTMWIPASTNNVILASLTGAPGAGSFGLIFSDGTALSSLAANTAGFFADSMGANVEMISIDESNRVRSLAWPRDVRVATQFDKTLDTTLANVTNLTHNVNAGKTYSFEARLFTTSAATGGVKAAISGTATATSIIYDGLIMESADITQTRATALGTVVGNKTNVTAALIIIKGTIVVNAAGTLTVQFAQNASDAAASSVLVNSSFVVDQLP